MRKKKFAITLFKSSLLFQTCYIFNIKLYNLNILWSVLNLRRNWHKFILPTCGFQIRDREKESSSKVKHVANVQQAFYNMSYSTIFLVNVLIFKIFNYKYNSVDRSMHCINHYIILILFVFVVINDAIKMYCINLQRIEIIMNNYWFGMEMAYVYPYAFVHYSTSHFDEEMRGERTLIKLHLKYN